MILCFSLSMPNRGSWNGRWSGENDIHVITKSDLSAEKCQELDGKDFFYRWDDGWTACVSCKLMAAREAARLEKRNAGFCGYDWMVRSIVQYGEIRKPAHKKE